VRQAITNRDPGRIKVIEITQGGLGAMVCRGVVQVSAYAHDPGRLG
jgi:hypothetical protein